jgi:GNAT superfamily N-acetyltransferase
MENKNIIIRLLHETDIDKINAFHNRIYNDDRTREKFAWEFFDAPAGNAIYVVAEDTGNNKIVGTQCAIPVYLKSVGGQLILSAKSEDTLVDPDYRGMQLFEKMYDFLFDSCKKKGILYIWGFTPALKPFLKIGFEAPYFHHQSLMAINILKSYKYISGLNPKNKSLDKLKIFGMTLLSKPVFNLPD